MSFSYKKQMVEYIFLCNELLIFFSKQKLHIFKCIETLFIKCFRVELFRELQSRLLDLGVGLLATCI